MDRVSLRRPMGGSVVSRVLSRVTLFRSAQWCRLVAVGLRTLSAKSVGSRVTVVLPRLTPRRRVAFGEKALLPGSVNCRVMVRGNIR